MSLEPPEIRPTIYSTPPADEWGSALIVACLALGFIASWGVYEMHARLAQESNFKSFRRDLDVLNGQQNDLGRLMADPRTRLVRLTPVDGDSPLRLLSVAWNQQTQSGVLFGEDLAAGGQRWYLLWLVSAPGRDTVLRIGPTQTGRDVYPFSSPQPAAAPTELILTSPDQTDYPHQALARGKVAQED